MKVSVGLAFLCLVVVSCGTDGGEGMTGPDDRAHSIEIVPKAVSFGAVGSTVQFEATVLDASGESLADVPVTWSTAGSGVIEVDVASGLVTSLGNGMESLRATVGTTEAEADAVVEQVPVSLTSDASTVELDRIGATMALGPFAVDSNGVAVTTPGVFSYTSADPSTVSVDADGVVKANYFGEAAITVSRTDLVATVTVRVQANGSLEPVLGEVQPCQGGRVGTFPCDQVDLVAFLPPAGLGAVPGTSLSDLWGWRDSLSMREYALVGRDDGITFVDVTEPLFPRAVGHLPASTPPSRWRDVKVYRDHAYIVAAAPAHGTQVFDLTRLRDAGTYTVFTEDERYIDIGGAQNLMINEDTGYGYIVGASDDVHECDGGLHVIDLAHPVHPVFAGCFADSRVGATGPGYTQDVQCVVYQGPDPDYGGREICIGSGETALYVVDVTDKTSVTPVAVATYPGAAYVYQGWLSADHGYFFQSDSGDELRSINDPPTRTNVWDLTDLDEPLVVGTLAGPAPATDFNLFVLDDRLFISNGAFGLRIVDVTDPVNAVEVGFFDTHPGGDRASDEDGSLSNYPFLGGGRVLVTSREEGLFILEPRG